MEISSMRRIDKRRSIPFIKINLSLEKDSLHLSRSNGWYASISSLLPSLRLVFVLSYDGEKAKKKNGAGKKERTQRASRICHRADKNWAEYNLTECTKRVKSNGVGGPRRWLGFPLLQTLPHSRRPFCGDGQLSPLVIFYMFSPPTEISPARSHFAVYPNFAFSDGVCHKRSPPSLSTAQDAPLFDVLRRLRLVVNAFVLSRKIVVATPWHRRRDATSLFYLTALSLLKLTNLYIQIWFLKY